MHTAMLWFDNSQTALTVKIQKAVDYYQRKYGRAPELCLVHPSMFGDEKEIQIPGMAIRTYRYVLPGHLWIGVEDGPEEIKA